MTMNLSASVHNARSTNWIIPHVVPRHHGLITIYAPLLPKDYDHEEAPPDLCEAGYFAGLLEQLYDYHHQRSFVVPWAWTKTEQLACDNADMIIKIAKSHPTICLRLRRCRISLRRSGPCHARDFCSVKTLAWQTLSVEMNLGGRSLFRQT